MLKKILPILFLLFGIGAGIGVGFLLRTPPDSTEDAQETRSHAKDESSEESSGFEYIKLNNQFVVPIVEHERVTSLVVLSLSLEAQVGMKEQVYSLEPKLRDAFLQVLFDHANMGGFSGSFTQSDTLSILRDALRDVAQNEFGDSIANVLIIDLARQDV